MPKTVADQRARQGPMGRPVLMVLVGSMILLAIAMIWFVSWSGSTTPPSPQQTSSQQQNKAGSSSGNTSSVPAANPAYPAPAAGGATTR